MGTDKKKSSLEILHQDQEIAYIILQYYIASQEKILYELRRDVPNICTAITEFGLPVTREELAEFTSTLYGDAARFVQIPRPE